MPSTIRFIRQYMRPDASATVEHEVTYARGETQIPATVYRPQRRGGTLPGWVVLHGLTRTGRRHPSLIRFARSLACAGNVVFVPDIPEWRALRVAPAVAIETIRAAVRALQQRDDVEHRHAALFGSSFGATQALIAAADEETAALLHGVASWGGYCDIRRVFRFGLTGLHEIDGVTYQTQPDPYGAWVMAGNYLPYVPGYHGTDNVARALHALAIESGERGFYAWDPVYDASKVRLRDGLNADERELFDLLAPLTTARRRSDEHALTIAALLADTAIRMDPLLDPQPFLPRVRTPILFAHGRDDRLVPFSESILLARAVPAQRRRSLTITSLFQHSGGTESTLGRAGLVREGVRFMLLLRRVLALT